MDYYDFYFSEEDLKFINEVVDRLISYGVKHPRRHLHGSIFIKKIGCNSDCIKSKGVEYWSDVVMHDIITREE